MTINDRKLSAEEILAIAIPRVCVICGAKVRNMNPRTMTCDSVCTAAKKAGRTREQQHAWEMNHLGWGDEK